MEWYDYFDEDDYNSSGGAGVYYGDDAWADDDFGGSWDDWGGYDDTTYDSSPNTYGDDGFDDGGYIDISGFTNDADYQSPYLSPQQQAVNWEDATVGDYYKTGGVLGGLGGLLSQYGGKGTTMGSLLGGKDGSIGGKDIMGYLSKGYDAYLGKRENDRYNEMMQPMTDLYKAQAADVQRRRDNRDANLASEYAAWQGMMQPGWDRRDQRAENLRQKQGKTQSSSAAWDRAANEQRRDLTKSYQQQQIANAYDKRTGMLGGQLSALNPLRQAGYLERQENPWLSLLG